jgi:hypothetical protein
MITIGKEREPSAFKAWARTHLFRTWTAILTLVLFGLCFMYRPELLTWWLRSTMSAIEKASAMLPYPWGDRVEFALRGFGGSFWMQITFAIVLVRVLAWLIGYGWRRRRMRMRRYLTRPDYRWAPAAPASPAVPVAPAETVGPASPGPTPLR